MRTVKLVVATLALLMLSTFAWAKAPKSAIVNSAHDFRTSLSGASFTLCNFCHVAHKTAAVKYPSNIGPLLWNHTLSAVTSYGVYSSPGFNGLGTDVSDVGALNAGAYTITNLCLGCHDGTVGINSWYEPVTSSSFSNIPSSPAIFVPNTATIKDLTNTHPINFTYNAALATAAHILTPASTTSVDGTGEVPLYAGKMQCGTCHDPHNGASGIFERNFPTQASGSFCTYCHL